MRGVALRLRSEDGFTLVELLTVLTMSGLILGALLALWSGAASRETANAARFQSLDDARNGLERLTREVREAVAVTGVTGSVVHLKVWKRDLAGATPSVLHEIVYDCSAAGSKAGTFACQRTDVTAGTAPTQLLDGISSSSVFETTAGQPELQFEFKVAVPKATNPIVLRGAASPRNCEGALSTCI